jgi:carboxyl-terminal processing protease
MKNTLLYTLCIAYCIVPVLTNTYKGPAKDPAKPKQDFETSFYNWSHTFAETINLAKQRHYRVEDLEDCMIKAIDSFLNNLDKHSALLDPKTYKMILDSTSGEFYGIGVVIDNTRQPKDKHLTIIDVVPGGPAEKSELRPMDKIVEIDGKPLDGMTTDEATARIKGPRDTKVQLKIMREKNQNVLTFDIKRDLINEQNTLSFYLDDQNICYLLLNSFSENALKQLASLIELSSKKGHKALILDLRNNLGGLLASAIDIAGFFLDKGTHIVSSRNKDNKETDKYATRRDPLVKNPPPIFILVNNYTASAAEILAGSLRIHSDAGNNNLQVFLVGSESHGKGTVQEVIPISNNCALKLTTSIYYFSNDTTIQACGLQPDFVIERMYPPTEQVEWFTKHYGHEASESSNYLKPHGYEEKDKKEEKSEADAIKNWAERAKETLQLDNQFRETINLINLFYLGKTMCKVPMKTRKEALDFMRKHYLGDTKIRFTEIK